MSVAHPYPWQETAWQGLQKRRAEGRLPHALLLHGQRGLGKSHFARLFAQALLCEHPDAQGHACGSCRGCRLFLAGSHPDALHVEPEEPGKPIRIDPVRRLAYLQGLSPQYAGYKVIRLEPADRLTESAANALLKTLEEPTAATILLLVTDRPAALLPTIRSRCQMVALQGAGSEAARQWLASRYGAQSESLLAAAGGAPLTAVQLGESKGLERRDTLFTEFESLLKGRADPVQLAEQWLKREEQELLTWLYGWSCDLIRARMGAARLENADLQPRLQAMAEQVDLHGLYRRLDGLLQARRLVQTTANRQLLLERLLVEWAETGARRRG